MRDRPTNAYDASAGLLDLKLLRLFDLLYSTQQRDARGRAARPEPADGQHLAGRLRRQLGDPLFVRTAAGMQPTPRADELIGPAREALAALRRLAAPRAKRSTRRARRGASASA